jgi:uncharacterized protein (TIGR02466 family)
MDLLPLFACNVFSTILKVDKTELLKDKYFNNSIQADDETLKKSNPNYRILENYPHIKKAILNEWLKVARNIFNYQTNFVITTSWITKNEYGMSSQFHHHKNSFYSGVYYFDTYDKNSAPIQFATPLVNHPDFLIEPSAYNVYNCPSWSTHPKTDLLIMFPSYLDHRVALHKSKTPRRSLAFNIAPVGEYGISDSKISNEWLHESNS